ncbi:MAG TPA: hypothetical protein VKV16_09610 [Solirubrobacteraceae bacterium]|nr:hypothetical protein [Solirubrobacteraceae bacterium]
MATKRFLLVVLLSVIALAGCGSSHPLTVGELTSKADLICERDNAKREELGRRVSTASSLRSAGVLEAIAESAPRVASYEMGAVSELSELQPPSSLSREWDRLVGDLRELAKDTARLGEYAKQRNATAAEQLLAKSRGSRQRALSIATRHALAPCGRAN